MENLQRSLKNEENLFYTLNHLELQKSFFETRNWLKTFQIKMKNGSSRRPTTHTTMASKLLRHYTHSFFLTPSLTVSPFLSISFSYSLSDCVSLSLSYSISDCVSLSLSYSFSKSNFLYVAPSPILLPLSLTFYSLYS